MVEFELMSFLQGTVIQTEAAGEGKTSTSYELCWLELKKKGNEVTIYSLRFLFPHGEKYQDNEWCVVSRDSAICNWGHHDNMLDLQVPWAEENLLIF